MESRACQVLSRCKILTHQLTVPQPCFWEDTYQPVPRHLLWAQGVNSSCDLHAFLTPTCPNYSQLQEWVLGVFFLFYTEEMLYNFFSLENAAEMNVFWILVMRSQNQEPDLIPGPLSAGWSPALPC